MNNPVVSTTDGAINAVKVTGSIAGGIEFNLDFSRGGVRTFDYYDSKRNLRFSASRIELMNDVESIYHGIRLIGIGVINGDVPSGFVLSVKPAAPSKVGTDSISVDFGKGYKRNGVLTKGAIILKRGKD